MAYIIMRRRKGLEGQPWRPVPTAPLATRAEADQEVKDMPSEHWEYHVVEVPE